MNRQEKVILILGIISIGLICFVVYLGINLDKSKQDNFASNNWACMDGCYNMLLVINNVSKFDYNDSGNKSLHDSCTQLCLEQYSIDGKREQ